MNNTKKWFKLFTSCMIVNGSKESLIYDTERNEFYDIPNEFAELLEDTKTYTIEQLKEGYGEGIINVLDQFINMEVAFYTNEPELFPEIDLTYETPYRINNVIFEVSDSSKYNFTKAVNQFDALGGIGYQFRFLNELNENELRRIFENFSSSRALYIEILYPYNKETDYTFFEKILQDFPRIIVVKIYGATKFYKLNEHEGNRVLFVEKNIKQDTKEVISTERFVTEIGLFTEAQQHNLGLNRKISITHQGEVKNYINHKKSFGHIDDINIAELIENEAFNHKWYLTNDKIETCKDCQYRYACVSNSDIIEKEGKLFKTEMCNFNPITNTWA